MLIACQKLHSRGLTAPSVGLYQPPMSTRCPFRDALENKFCCTRGQETRATAECCIFCNKHWVCCLRKCNGKPCTPPSHWSAATVAELGKDNKQLARQATATIDNAIVVLANFKARQQAAQEAEAEADFADFLAEVESGYPGGGEARHGPSTLSQSSRLQ